MQDWRKLIGDVPSATPMLGGFLHHAEVIQITGRSYRLRPAGPHGEALCRRGKTSQSAHWLGGWPHGFKTSQSAHRHGRRYRRVAIVLAFRRLDAATRV
jgi:hypothetical protein